MLVFVVVTLIAGVIFFVSINCRLCYFVSGKVEKISYSYNFKEPLNDYATTIIEPMVIVTIGLGEFKYTEILPDVDMIITS